MRENNSDQGSWLSAVQTILEGKMVNTHCMPIRFPVGTKYVLEGRGQFVRRYVEFPNGRRMQLKMRKGFAARARDGNKQELNKHKTLS